jgi:hypothetical protein
VTFGDEDPGTVIDRYFADGFAYYNDGVLLDRERLLAHVRPARKNALAVRGDVHDALVQGDRLAARYTLHATMRKGQVLSTEVHMFGRLAPDGRISSVDQITRIPPAE